MTPVIRTSKHRASVPDAERATRIRRMARKVARASKQAQRRIGR
ncbi:MAG: hypothetical protein NUW01_08215 [Gemmatimonadaceae bacterium]|nr:hypothetical protein [Gemmatimonadaceae bacterium]